MKKLLSGLLAITLILSLSGCGLKEKAQQKVGEKLAEKILEGAGGSDVDLDLDGDKVVIKGKDGEKMVFGDTEWPNSGIAKSIPEFKDGTVTSVMEINDSFMISLEDVAEGDFEKYLAKIKKDFTEESYEMKSEGHMTFGAQNSKGIGVSLTYTEENTLSITLVQSEE